MIIINLSLFLYLPFVYMWAYNFSTFEQYSTVLHPHKHAVYPGLDSVTSNSLSRSLVHWGVCECVLFIWICSTAFTGHVTPRRGKKRIPERCSTSSDPHLQRSETPRFPPPAHTNGSSFKNGEKTEHYLQSFTASKQLVSYCLERFLCVIFSSLLSLLSARYARYRCFAVYPCFSSWL